MMKESDRNPVKLVGKSELYRIAYFTIIAREIRRFMRIWQQTLLPSATTMTLYFTIFGHLIGQRIGQMDGVDYIKFIVPGLIMMAVITNSFGNIVSSFFGIRFQKSIEELLTSPVPAWLMIAGFVTGSVVRGMFVAVIVTGVSALFTELEVHSFPLLVTIALITSVLFSLAGLINAVYARNFDDISIVPTFILTPLTYLGGVFYSISMLPEFWQFVSKLNPIFYMINGFRFAMLGKSDIGVGVSIAIILLANIVLFFVCHRLIQTNSRIKE